MAPRRHDSLDPPLPYHDPPSYSSQQAVVLPPIDFPTHLTGYPFTPHQNALPPAVLSQQKPKPRPIYAGYDDEKENELPEHTLASILAYGKSKPVTTQPPAKATPKGRGKKGVTAGVGVKTKLAAGKRKQKEIASEGEGEGPRKRGGRQPGSINWSDEDLAAMLDCTDEVLPAGKKEWGRAYDLFVEWAQENSRPVRSLESMEKRFKAVSDSCLHSHLYY
jgi:hypothetical protein